MWDDIFEALITEVLVMKLGLFALLFGFGYSPALFASNTNCQGSVNVPSWQSSADVDLSFDQLEPGSTFSLWAPITSQGDSYVDLQVTQVETTPDGPRVSAIYMRQQASSISFIYNVDSSSGAIELQEFKGIEGTIEFGPGTLNCVKALR